MKGREIRPLPADMDFTDLSLTGFGGGSLLARTAQELGLFDLLSGAVSVKVRRRGASDAEMLWAIVASLARGHGALSDLDALRRDEVACALLGLGSAPDSRRAGEWLSRLGRSEVRALWGVARELARRVAPPVVTHEVATRGYVPVFVDGTGIEVDGSLFQWSRPLYDGSRGYWLHGAFVGGLWASGRLCPGGGWVTLGWHGQLEHDVAPLLPAGTPVWVRADNAYYKGEFVRFCAARGWDYSVSVTHAQWKAPVLEQLEGLAASAWTDIGMGEEAILATHRPRGWERQAYVVVRRREERGQLLLVPRHTVILVSRGDLPLEELVRRHRGKQGQENAFKGPLRDMDLHHPPCRSYRANQAFYALGQIAQMLLRAVQFTKLPKGARRHGIRPIIRHVMCTVARLVHSARQWRLDFAKTSFRLDWLYAAATRLPARGPPQVAA